MKKDTVTLTGTTVLAALVFIFDYTMKLHASICTACTIIAVAYTVALFWPALAPLRLWIVAIPVLIAFLTVLAIGAWIG